MDAIAGFMSENGVIVLLIILAAVGLFWLLSRFFKLTLIIAVVVLALLAFQHFSPSGDLKTKLRGVVDKVVAKGGDVMEGAREFFAGQKDNMQKHIDSALDNGDKKEKDRGSKKK
jgi:cell shape-determining protein MreC